MRDPSRPWTRQHFFSDCQIGKRNVRIRKSIRENPKTAGGFEGGGFVVREYQTCSSKISARLTRAGEVPSQGGTPGGTSGARGRGSLQAPLSWKEGPVT